ncbi:hypothetical protein KC353_g13550, partial [Hortaea werneckii]
MNSSDTTSPAARRTSVTAADISHLPEVGLTVANDAAKVTQNETSMTLLQGLKTYPKAVGWSVLLSACIIMEGFDIALISSLYAVPAFQQRFGDRQDDGSYEISAAWQSGLSNGALIGEIFGLFLTGIIAERIGSFAVFPNNYICVGAPESPWWLVRRGRIEDAKKEIRRLTSRTQSDLDPAATVNMMIYTNELEKKEIAGAKYWDCFKGVNLRRTEIVTFVWAIQTLCG